MSRKEYMGSRGTKFMELLHDNPDLTPFEKASKWFEVAGLDGYDGHDAQLVKILTLESATFNPTKAHPHNSQTVFSFTIPRNLCNMAGSLHGGAVALIFDICTSTAITACSKDGFWDTGHVSRSLNCTYLRPCPAGTKVWVESQVVHMGKRMCLTTGLIRDADGKVYYTGEHQKASVGASSL